MKEDEEYTANDEFKSPFSLKTDNELFHEDKNIAYGMISAKRISLPRQGENWEILQNNKTVLTLKGTRFTNPEKRFLRTIDGMQLLISEYKKGNTSVVKIKEILKRKL